MNKNAVVALCAGTAGVIYVGAVSFAYAKGKKDGRGELIEAVRADVKTALKEMLENQNK